MRSGPQIPYRSEDPDFRNRCDEFPAELPVLPRSSDAPTTARWIQAIVSGAMPAPAAVTAQVDCLVRALGELDRPASRTASA